MCSLVELSVRVGRDPLLVQAGTGNTSEKRDGVLWIKASGKWLAHADREDSFVPVNLATLRCAVSENQEFVAEHASPSGQKLRSSIETTMHAVLPHRVTIHVHSVSTIAWAVRRDGPARIAERLSGLPWQWIPYVASGLPLAQRVAEALSRSPQSNVFVLANHGLVVCGEDCDAAEMLLEEVERRLAIAPRAAAPADYPWLERAAEGTEWRVPGTDAVHALATDAVSVSILKRGTLYPCQAVFLAASFPVFSPMACLCEQVAQYAAEYGVRPRFVAIEGAGVLVSAKMTMTEHETLIGLARVVQRIEEHSPVCYLTEPELASVLSVDAYRYRGLVETYERAAASAWDNRLTT